MQQLVLLRSASHPTCRRVTPIEFAVRAQGSMFRADLILPILRIDVRRRTVSVCPPHYSQFHSFTSSLLHCCRTTWSPSFRPFNTSVNEPFESPTVTETLRLPSFWFLSGISTDAFFWLSYITAFSGPVSTPLCSSSRISALAVMLAFNSPPGLLMETRTSNVVTLSFSTPIGAILVTLPLKVRSRKLSTLMRAGWLM